MPITGWLRREKKKNSTAINYAHILADKAQICILQSFRFFSLLGVDFAGCAPAIDCM
jgi:hypothetical protein